MPLGTSYKPLKTSDFEASKLTFDAQGVSTNFPISATTNLDYLLTDDCLMTGVWLIVSGSNYGDCATFQVVDTTGFTGYPAGTVLNQFITNWFFPQNTDTQIDLNYPAKLIGGLTIRLVYSSTGTTSPFVACNYKLHKVLV